MDDKKSCENCYYGLRISRGCACSFICRRFPESINKSCDDWCGEWNNRNDFEKK